jgi:hypothetical protein
MLPPTVPVLFVVSDVGVSAPAVRLMVAQSDSDGAAGVLAEHVPLQVMVPVFEFLMPQEFGAE